MPQGADGTGHRLGSPEIDAQRADWAKLGLTRPVPIIRPIASGPTLGCDREILTGEEPGDERAAAHIRLRHDLGGHDE